MSCYQVGDVIHVVTQNATGVVYYNTWDMATDTWGLATSETAVAAAAFAPTAPNPFVTLVVRSGGEIVIGYGAGQTAATSAFHMVRYTRRTGVNTYSAPVSLDNGGSINWTTPIAVLGASDRVHFFLHDTTNTNLYQRTLTSADVLQAFPATPFEDTTVATPQHYATRGFSYVSGADTIVVLPYETNVAASGHRQSVARFTSSDDPTPSTTIVSDVAPAAVNNQLWVSGAVSGNIVHYLYTYGASPNINIAHDSDGGTNTWGTDVDEWTGSSNVLRHSTNVYTRGGENKLAMVVDDAGVMKYGEISIPSSDITPPANPTGLTATLITTGD
jgi:hypothetical protein